MTDRPLLLVAAFGDPICEPDTGAWIERVRRAEQAGVDAVLLDGFPLDSMLLAALAATRTSTVGIVPIASTTITEPFHVSTRLATIDVVGQGRTGWLATTTPAAAAAGAVTWDVPADVVADAAEHVDAVRALWDSWEHGAEVRDGATARFLDRSKVHHVNHRGEHLRLRGPSITPRPPQGHPVILARDPALAGVDVLVTHAAPATARPWLLDATAPGAPVETALPADVVEAVARAAAAGALGAVVDGALDLAGLVAAVAAQGVRPAAPATGTLRERFGLAPAANRFAKTA